MQMGSLGTISCVTYTIDYIVKVRQSARTRASRSRHSQASCSPHWRWPRSCSLSRKSRSSTIGLSSFRSPVLISEKDTECTEGEARKFSFFALVRTRASQFASFNDSTNATTIKLALAFWWLHFDPIQAHIISHVVLTPFGRTDGE